jgi:hypothetical protein
VAVKAKKQFYLLGPNVQGLSDVTHRKLNCKEFYEDYRTVVSEIHDVNPGPDPLVTLRELCRTLKEPTIIFCSSPASATKVVQSLIPSLSVDGHVVRPSSILTEGPPPLGREWVRRPTRDSFLFGVENLQQHPQLLETHFEFLSHL